VNLTFSLPFGGNSIDELVVQQAALGYVQTILLQYNLENLDDAFVEYRSPKFVDAAITVYAVGVTRAVMNNAQRALFLQVFRQGFDPVLASKASQAPMAVYDASVLYQIPPLAVADVDSASTASDEESIRNRLDANNSTNSSSSSSSTTITPGEVSPDSASAPLTSNLAVRVLVRATCSGPDCHDGTLAAALWEKGRQHAGAWATGIREQAGKASNAALRTYFGPLVTIVVESPTHSGNSSHNSNSNAPGVGGDVYHPLSEVDETQNDVPTWMWIVLGVDGGILLVALLVACCRVSKRRKEWTGDKRTNKKERSRSNDRDSTSPASPSWARPNQEEPIPEQYPHEPYPNMAGLKEAAGSSHRDTSGNDDDEFHDEGSDRIFDDGIRVREAQVDADSILGNDSDELHDDGSDRIFDDGIRVREVQVEPVESNEGARQRGPSTPPPQGPPPPPPSSPTLPHDDLPYDDGVRVSMEDAGQTSRVHDDGIHISNSIHDID
jgi:hypothetical protein